LRVFVDFGIPTGEEDYTVSISVISAEIPPLTLDKGVAVVYKSYGLKL
jgi:hypothetical protein